MCRKWLGSCRGFLQSKSVPRYPGHGGSTTVIHFMISDVRRQRRVRAIKFANILENSQRSACGYISIKNNNSEAEPIRLTDENLSSRDTVPLSGMKRMILICYTRSSWRWNKEIHFTQEDSIRISLVYFEDASLRYDSSLQYIGWSYFKDGPISRVQVLAWSYFANGPISRLVPFLGRSNF